MRMQLRLAASCDSAIRTTCVYLAIQVWVLLACQRSRAFEQRSPALLSLRNVFFIAGIHAVGDCCEATLLQWSDDQSDQRGILLLFFP